MEGVTGPERPCSASMRGPSTAWMWSRCSAGSARSTRPWPQILIDSYQAGAVLNGDRRRLAPGLSVFHTVIATEAGYHDVSPEILTEFHPAAGPRVPVGCDAAGPGPPGGRPGGAPCGVWTDGHRGDLPGGRGQTGGDRAAWHPLSVDMETAAVAHVCYVNQVPFLAVRTLTDTADQRGAACFEQNCDKAAWIAKEVTRTLLETWRCQGL